MLLCLLDHTHMSYFCWPRSFSTVLVCFDVWLQPSLEAHGHRLGGGRPESFSYVPLWNMEWSVFHFEFWNEVWTMTYYHIMTQWHMLVDWKLLKLRGQRVYDLTTRTNNHPSAVSQEKMALCIVESTFVGRLWCAILRMLFWTFHAPFMHLSWWWNNSNTKPMGPKYNVMGPKYNQNSLYRIVHTQWYIHNHTFWQTYIQTYRLTYRHTYRHTYGHTYRYMIHTKYTYRQRLTYIALHMHT